MGTTTMRGEPPTGDFQRRIVVTTFGSLGDLHPYLAVALGLQARGHDVAIATGACYRRKIEALGLGFAPARPDSDWIADPATLRRLSHPRWGLVRVAQMLLRPLRESYDDTLAAAAGADLLVGNLATYATGLVAEKKGIPWVSVMHIPTGIFSASDPPLLPGFPWCSKRLRFLGPAFWGPLGGTLKWLSRPIARPWHQLRAEIGLPRVTGINPLTDWHSPRLHLALFSRLLADKQPDWPAQTIVTGFPWFDQDGSAGLPTNLAQFMDHGPPPIVFTLGTAVATDPGLFYQQSAAAARLLGRRAVLILHNPASRPNSLPDGVIACQYAPFSQLFPRAAAVVHHGGIGTTGLVMRAGCPMLVMPCAWDQPDNAERAVRLGVARAVPRHQYSTPRAVAELQFLLNEPAYARRASEVGQLVRQEDGAGTACDAITRILQTDSSVRKRKP